MNRRTIAIRQFVALSLACFAALFVIAKCTGCGAPLTPADKKALAADALRIEICKQYGRDCKADKEQPDCFAVYDDCIRDAGLR